MTDQKWLKDAIDRLEGKLDRIDTRLNDIDKVSVKQNEQLAHHIFRTELAEENIALLREQVLPLEKWAQYFTGIIKLIGILATIGAIVEVIIKLVEFAG